MILVVVIVAGISTAQEYIGTGLSYYLALLSTYPLLWYVYSCSVNDLYPPNT